VILGSCGGYHNLGKVLEHAPDAHLISTKQTGTTVINDAITKGLNDHLLEGDDIDWPSFWKERNLVFKGKDRENLGAIFIKAYRRIYHQWMSRGRFASAPEPIFCFLSRTDKQTLLTYKRKPRQLLARVFLYYFAIALSSTRIN